MYGTDLHVIVKGLPVPVLEEAEGDALAGDAGAQPLQGLASLLPCCMPPGHTRSQLSLMQKHHSSLSCLLGVYVGL